MAKSKVDQWLDEMERDVAAGEAQAAAAATGLMPLGAPAADVPANGRGAPVAPSNGDALSQIWSPQTNGTASRKTVEDLLVAQGTLDADKLLQARTVQNTSKSKKISQILLEMGAVKEE